MPALHVSDIVCELVSLLVFLLAISFVNALPGIIRAWRGAGVPLPPPATPSTAVPENTDG